LANRQRNFANEVGTITSAIGEIGNYIRNNGLFTASFAGSDKGAEAMQQAVEKIGQRCGNTIIPKVARQTDFTPTALPRMVGLISEGDIAETKLVIPTPRLSNADVALLSTGLEMLQDNFLHKELRLKGHCYGAFGYYEPYGNVIILETMADPNISRTYQTYKKILRHLKALDWKADEARWRAVKRLAHFTVKPDASNAPENALNRHFQGRDEYLEQTIGALQNVSIESIIKILRDTIGAGLDKSCILAGGSRDDLEKLKVKFIGERTEMIEHSQLLGT
jgi:Zn-dependent M16 (insulinase) family peptidase